MDGGQMSRSYKKIVGYCDRCPSVKRNFNREFRHTTFDYPSGKAYKKRYCSYDIKDWSDIIHGDKAAVMIKILQWGWNPTLAESEKEYRQMRSK